MKNAGKWLFYSTYIMAVAVFFIYYLFPSDAVKKQIAFYLNRANPGLDIMIDNIKPVFPPGLKLYNVSLYHIDNLLIEAERINITYGFLSLFRPETTLFFKSGAYEGILKGRADITADELTINADLSDIMTQNIPVLQNLFNRTISGILSGKITYSGNKKFAGTANAKLNLSDCEVEVLTPLFNLKSFTFDSAETNVVMDNRKLQIKQCVVKGHQVDGNISGFIAIEDPVNKSVLNLTAKIKPHPSFLADLRKVFPADLLFKKRHNKNGFPVRLSGTLDEPVFSLD